MKYLFFDFETTGLDERYSEIIEYAGVLVDDLTEVDTIENFVWDRLPHWDTKAYEMHQRSGLLRAWEAAITAKTTLFSEQAAVAIVSMLERHGVKKNECLLAGHGIHFDRRFIKQYMPKLDDFLHYRHLDISVLDTFFMNSVGIPRMAGDPAHRSMADVRGSIRRYREYYAAAKERFTGWVPQSSVEVSKNNS